METKVCRHCRRELPATLEYFYKAGNKRVGLRAICKKCNSKESTPGKKREYKYEGVDRGETKERLYHIKQNYKVEPEVIMEIMDDQKGCCAVCKESLVYPDSRKTYAIDHCHDTDEIRGLLCVRCNTGIALLGDNAESLLDAFIYLTKKPNNKR